MYYYFSVNCGEYDPSSLNIHVSLYRHDFAFGSAVVAQRISSEDDEDKKYQDVYYENFEWAVFNNAMKWRQMEQVKVGQRSIGALILK